MSFDTDIATLVGVVAGVVVLGQKFVEFGIERVKLRRAKNGHAPSKGAQVHVLQPQLKALQLGQNDIDEELNKINQTLNGNGDPSGGLVALVQRHDVQLEHLERRKTPR